LPCASIRWCIPIDYFGLVLQNKDRLVAGPVILRDPGKARLEVPYLQAVAATCGHGDSATDEIDFPSDTRRKRSQQPLSSSARSFVTWYFRRPSGAPFQQLQWEERHFSTTNPYTASSLSSGKQLEKLTGSVVGENIFSHIKNLERNV
jgi:hypothetical protein